jgi:hypothetical protein
MVAASNSNDRFGKSTFPQTSASLIVLTKAVSAVA